MLNDGRQTPRLEASTSPAAHRRREIDPNLYASACDAARSDRAVTALCFYLEGRFPCVALTPFRAFFAFNYPTTPRLASENGVFTPYHADPFGCIGAKVLGRRARPSRLAPSKGSGVVPTPAVLTRLAGG